MSQPESRRTSQAESTHPVMSRSNSVNSLTEAKIRPKSRGSTTSLQSVGVGNAFQPPPPLPPPPAQQQHQDVSLSIEQAPMFMQHGPQPVPHMYTQRPDDAPMQYQHMMQPHQPMLDQNGVHLPPHDMRPMSQQGFHDVQQFPMQYPHGMPQYSVHPHMQHMRHHSEHYEGSPAPEDSSNENGGAKRRKGAASSMANDQELRRLLAQYQGKTLKEIAIEVQKNEGSGGKSEKAKQVFAMLWLQENCRRSTNSVRRDRVFARYTERCGNERVPTLNPASFGKLVRIIFPNVQTRRLGVRGESKYHYVDLSLVPDDEAQNTLERPSTAGSIAPPRPTSSAGLQGSFLPHARSASISHVPVRENTETADFPIPTSVFVPPVEEKEPEIVDVPVASRMDCQYLNTATIRISTANMSTSLLNALPAARANMPATMATYLAMPSDHSLSQPAQSTQETPIELPDIHEYLAGTNYDHSIAKLLHDLYRSYCIDVIDAFRKCKEKSFFNHHSAFNGKMTVPVSKLFTMDCVAPWIHECDMRMYQQIVRFLAPLVQQNVPEQVWAVFERISSRLVSHLVTAFEEKCPVHVVVAKVVPAARFTHLLKKLRGANTAALQFSAVMDDPNQRTQMWLDLMAMVDPEVVLDDSTPSPECLDNVRSMLKHDLRTLITPLDEPLVSAAENDPTSAFVDFMSEPDRYRTATTATEQSSGLLEKWIQWLERVPMAFQGHHPQCMLDWHLRFWRSVMSQIGGGGARSYQAWWYLESFATHMLAYMAQMEGLLLSSEQQKTIDEKELEKKKQDEQLAETSVTKRKRSVEDIGGAERSQSRRPSVVATSKVQPVIEQSLPSPSLNEGNPADVTDAEMEEIERGGPLHLPTFRTGLSSPIKQVPARLRQDPNAHIDDSGIELGLDEHGDPDAIEAEKEAKKFNKRDWFLSSDPVEPGPTGMGILA